MSNMKKRNKTPILMHTDNSTQQENQDCPVFHFTSCQVESSSPRWHSIHVCPQLDRSLSLVNDLQGHMCKRKRANITVQRPSHDLTVWQSKWSIWKHVTTRSNTKSILSASLLTLLMQFNFVCIIKYYYTADNNIW